MSCTSFLLTPRTESWTPEAGSPQVGYVNLNLADIDDEDKDLASLGCAVWKLGHILALPMELLGATSDNINPVLLSGWISKGLEDAI